MTLLSTQIRWTCSTRMYAPGMQPQRNNTEYQAPHDSDQRTRADLDRYPMKQRLAGSPRLRITRFQPARSGAGAQALVRGIGRFSTNRGFIRPNRGRGSHASAFRRNARATFRQRTPLAARSDSPGVPPRSSGPPARPSHRARFRRARASSAAGRYGNHVHRQAPVPAF